MLNYNKLCNGRCIYDICIYNKCIILKVFEGVNNKVICLGIIKVSWYGLLIVEFVK